MVFKIGDIVSFLHEAGTGTILKIEGNQAEVMMDHGFAEWLPLNELVPRKALSIGEVQSKDRPRTSLEKGRAKAKAAEVIEADLHFEALVDFPKNFSSHEKLQIQLNEARKAIDRARRAGVKKVVLIHGVGQGRLRDEIYAMLERMDRIIFYDASFARYGKGATEVELR
ncbi:Smr/MutS family protein [Croceimicrobium hydrocarbonivorans]|uniref:Smr/MutS family protein n=1 Tax=Croceimicrobium hydrocarbonivorans TaxID=2761580 RepID=A0A7H0VCX0_9FLAO|nr:Smr/MutS family protein [Croceimicrobium hydrocarbonivorans]QNR23568.1 Smr/MutS family protein [Croceimicrobium hydrocarbonivorans]